MPVDTRSCGREQRLSFRTWQPGDPLETGVFGTLQPSAGFARRWSPTSCWYRCWPAIPEGWRLGYGGGYFEHARALRRRRKVMAIGVGFDLQFVRTCRTVPTTSGSIGC